MKFKEKCPKCETEIFFNEKDIKPLTEEEVKYFKNNHKETVKEMNKTKKTWYGIEKPYYDAWGKGMLKIAGRTPTGSVKCLCGNEFYVGLRFRKDE